MYILCLLSLNNPLSEPQRGGFSALSAIDLLLQQPKDQKKDGSAVTAPVLLCQSLHSFWPMRCKGTSFSPNHQI